MGITQVDFDSNTPTLSGNYLNGVYHYYLDPSLFGSSSINSAPFGFVDTIQNIVFSPFLDYTNLNISSMNFDTDKYGKIPGFAAIPKVYRIEAQLSNSRHMTLAKIDCFYNKSEYSFCGKLQVYPYRYFVLTDYINPPIMIQPQLVKNFGNKTQMVIKVDTILTSSCLYNLYVKDYKGDYKGNLEGSISTNPLFMPVGSSAYSQFISTSSATFRESTQLSLLENDVSLRQALESNKLDQYKNNVSNLASTIGGVVGSALQLNIGGILGSLGGGLVDYSMNKKTSQLVNKQAIESSKLSSFGTESMALAKIKDSINTPRSLKTLGNDAIFNLEHSYRKIDLIEYEIDYTYKRRINQYFFRYGYKTNKYEIPNLRTRKNFNYVKLAQATITSNTVPYEDLEEIKNIFENGLTFWHVENGTKILNYNVDNEEVI